MKLERSSIGFSGPGRGLGWVMVAAVLVVCLGLHREAAAEVKEVPLTRTALLMGVWGYQDPTFPELPATGIRADLTKMQAELVRLGFKVQVVENPTLKQAKGAVDAFGEELKKRGGAGLFYFSGHGAEHEGKNFLVPAGTSIRSSRDLDDEALNANRVLERMEESGIGVSLVFLDCCRNSLSKAGTSTGLAPMMAKGALIGFATRSGDTARAGLDGSPYTTALLNHLGTPGVSLPDMHTLVTEEMVRKNESQRPGQYVDLGGIYHLVPARSGSRGAVAGTGGRENPEFSLTPTGALDGSRSTFNPYEPRVQVLPGSGLPRLNPRAGEPLSPGAKMADEATMRMFGLLPEKAPGTGATGTPPAAGTPAKPPGEPPPQAVPATTAEGESEENLPVATAIPELQGCVISPYTKPGRIVDVRGKAPGTVVVCPFTGKKFRLPGIGSNLPESMRRKEGEVGSRASQMLNEKKGK